MLTLILQKYDDQPIDLMDDDLIMFEYEPDNTIQFSDDLRAENHHSLATPYAYTPLRFA
jgi:hypothetical protein